MRGSPSRSRAGSPSGATGRPRAGSLSRATSTHWSAHSTVAVNSRPSWSCAFTLLWSPTTCAAVMATPSALTMTPVPMERSATMRSTAGSTRATASGSLSMSPGAGVGVAGLTSGTLVGVGARGSTGCAALACALGWPTSSATRGSGGGGVYVGEQAVATATRRAAPTAAQAARGWAAQPRVDGMSRMSQPRRERLAAVKQRLERAADSLQARVGIDGPHVVPAGERAGGGIGLLQEGGELRVDFLVELHHVGEGRASVFGLLGPATQVAGGRLGLGQALL